MTELEGHDRSCDTVRGSCDRARGHVTQHTVETELYIEDIWQNLFQGFAVRLRVSVQRKRPNPSQYQ